MPNGFYDLWIEQNIRAVDTNECIFWPFERDKKGYARLHGRRLVHREECVRAHGEPPFEGAHAAHTCGKGSSACVNPKHLEWKTPSQNERDKVWHGTHNRGERSGVSKLTEEEARFIQSAPKSVTNAMLAATFGVARSTISRVRNGVDWAWLKNDE